MRWIWTCLSVLPHILHSCPDSLVLLIQMAMVTCLLFPVCLHLKNSLALAVICLLIVIRTTCVEDSVLCVVLEAVAEADQAAVVADTTKVVQDVDQITNKAITINMMTTNKSHLMQTTPPQAQEIDQEAIADMTRKGIPQDLVLLVVILEDMMKAAAAAEDIVMKAPVVVVDVVKRVPMETVADIMMTVSVEMTNLEMKAAEDVVAKMTVADIEMTNKAAENTTRMTIQTEKTISSEETTLPDDQDHPRRNDHPLVTDTHRPRLEDIIDHQDTATEAVKERETNQEKRAAVTEIDEEMTDVKKI